MSERAIDLESAIIDAHDRMSVVYATLMDLNDGEEELSRSTASAISGSALILRDVLHDLDEVLERQDGQA